MTHEISELVRELETCIPEGHQTKALMTRAAQALTRLSERTEQALAERDGHFEMFQHVNEQWRLLKEQSEAWAAQALKEDDCRKTWQARAEAFEKLAANERYQWERALHRAEAAEAELEEVRKTALAGFAGEEDETDALSQINNRTAAFLTRLKRSLPAHVSEVVKP